MSDDFDADELLMAIDQFEGDSMPPHLVERLRELVREHEARRRGPPTYRAIVDEISRMERHRPPHEQRYPERGLGETHEAHADRIRELVRKGRIGPR